MSTAYLVRECMTSPVTSIANSANLLEAALLLRRSGFRHLPVVDDDGCLVGIISDSDVLRAAPSLLSKITEEEYNAIFETTPLERVMSRRPLTVTPATPLREAAAILIGKKLGCLPVVEGGRLVGILTVTDMLRVLYRLLDTSPADTVAAKRPVPDP